MALTVGEDSYVSLSDANAFWNNHPGGDNWAAETDPLEKEKALRAATQWIDKSYEFKGYHPKDNDQLLSWPRVNVVDDEGRVRSSSLIPKEIKDATAWLADKALSSELLPATSRNDNIDSIKAGSVEIDFADNATSVRNFDYVTLLISDLIVSRGSSVRMLKI